MIWWTKGAQPPQLLADGEVVMASAYNGRLFSAIEEEKQPIAMLWDWQVFDLDGWVIPSGGKNVDDRQDLRQVGNRHPAPGRSGEVHLLRPGAQIFGAAWSAKHASLGIDMGPHMPTAPENAKTTLLFNYVWWADNRASLDERFAAWLAQ